MRKKVLPPSSEEIEECGRMLPDLKQKIENLIRDLAPEKVYSRGSGVEQKIIVQFSNSENCNQAFKRLNANVHASGGKMEQYGSCGIAVSISRKQIAASLKLRIEEGMGEEKQYKRLKPDKLRIELVKFLHATGNKYDVEFSRVILDSQNEDSITVANIWCSSLGAKEKIKKAFKQYSLGNIIRQDPDDNSTVLIVEVSSPDADDFQNPLAKPEPVPEATKEVQPKKQDEKPTTNQKPKQKKEQNQNQNQDAMKKSLDKKQAQLRAFLINAGIKNRSVVADYKNNSLRVNFFDDTQPIVLLDKLKEADLPGTFISHTTGARSVVISGKAKIPTIKGEKPAAKTKVVKKAKKAKKVKKAKKAKAKKARRGRKPDKVSMPKAKNLTAFKKNATDAFLADAVEQSAKTSMQIAKALRSKRASTGGLTPEKVANHLARGATKLYYSTGNPMSPFKMANRKMILRLLASLR